MEKSVLKRIKEMLRPRAEQRFAFVRWSRLPYMLIFALAPVFANMQEDVLAGLPDLFGLDAMSLLGAAYCLGAGVLFAFARLKGLKTYARWLAILGAALFISWLILPPGMPSLVFALSFMFVFGGCAGIAAFAFTYALNNQERFLGAALVSLFYLLWELDFSFRFFSGFFPRAYLSALVLGTLICLSLYRNEDFAEAGEEGQSRAGAPILLMLLFFFALKAIAVFYTYLPGAASPEALRVSALAGIGVFALGLYLYFRCRFSVWYMCNLFFMGMLLAAALYLLPDVPGARLVSRLAYGVEQLGFIASYWLLGNVLRRHASLRLFKWVIFITLILAMLLYLVPGLLAARSPEALPGAAALVAAFGFLLFFLLTPAYVRHIFTGDAPAAPASPSLAELTRGKGLTRREMEILPLLLEGLMHKECAARLDISLETAKFHARNIYRKLGVVGRSQLFSALYPQEGKPGLEEQENRPAESL